MPRWDRPRTGGDNPGDGDDARRRFNPDLFNPYPARPVPYMPGSELRGKIREAGGGTDKKPESPEQAEIRKLKNELHETQFTLTKTSKELGQARTELREAGDERRKLVDTVSRQERTIERKDAEIEKLRAPASILDGKLKDDAEQDSRIEKRAQRKSWFPSEKVTAAMSAGAGALGAVGVTVHQISGNTESIILAGAGFGFAALAIAKDKYEKGRAAKDADRPEDQ